jgi:hypothetical protein
VLERIIMFAVIVGAAYWYWSGPYQEKIHPGYEATVKQNDEDMEGCIRGEAYKQGTTGAGVGASTASKQCAEKFNLYELDGHWHSYDTARPN